MIKERNTLTPSLSLLHVTLWNTEDTYVITHLMAVSMNVLIVIWNLKTNKRLNNERRNYSLNKWQVIVLHITSYHTYYPYISFDVFIHSLILFTFNLVIFAGRSFALFHHRILIQPSTYYLTPSTFLRTFSSLTLSTHVIPHMFLEHSSPLHFYAIILLPCLYFSSALCRWDHYIFM